MHRFPKKERLCHQKHIQELFHKSSSVFLHPFKILYCSHPDASKASAGSMPLVLISVSRKQFKRAVDRNRIKRQIREAYRQMKGEIWSKGNPYSIGILYIAKEQQPYAYIEERLKKALLRMVSTTKASPPSGDQSTAESAGQQKD